MFSNDLIAIQVDADFGTRKKLVLADAFKAIFHGIINIDITNNGGSSRTVVKGTGISTAILGGI